MKQRTAIILSVGLTAFLLVVIGAVAATVTDQAQGSEMAASPAPSLAPELEAQLADREAEYQARLEEANAKLEDAYEKIQELETSTPPTESPEEQLYPVSADLAVGLALNLAPGSTLKKWPELVLFKGTPAYEILLNQGPIYISAEDAILLHDGTVSSGGGGGSGGQHEDDDDHEEEHEDD